MSERNPMAAALVLVLVAGATLAPTRGAAQERFFRDTVVPTLAGALGSWVGGIPVYLLLDRNAGDRRVKGDAGYSRTANVGLLISSALGAGAGVHIARRSSRGGSSLRRALAGAGLATLPFVLGYDDPYLPIYLLTLGTALQVVGAQAAVGGSTESEEPTADRVAWDWRGSGPTGSGGRER
jgi:hypothetical protein